MTRKRFIKLLMSHGMSRNTARMCAGFVRRDNAIRAEWNRLSKTLGSGMRFDNITYAGIYKHYPFMVVRFNT